MNRLFALVANNQLDCSFIARIAQALDGYGTTIVTTEDNVLDQLEKCTLIIIDSDDVQDVPGLVEKLRSSRHSLPIFVFMLYHDLSRAREVFKMGATDCLVKGLDETEFTARLKTEYLKNVRVKKMERPCP